MLRKTRSVLFRCASGKRVSETPLVHFGVYAYLGFEAYWCYSRRPNMGEDGVQVNSYKFFKYLFMNLSNTK